MPPDAPVAGILIAAGAPRVPIRTLALDIGVHTGWARSDGNYGVLDYSHLKATDHGWLCAEFHDWLDLTLQASKVGTLVIEQAVFGRGIRHAALVTGMIKIAHMVAWSRRVTRDEINAGSVRKTLCGRAKASDAELLAAVNSRGFSIFGQNAEHAVDAAALLIVHEWRAGHRPDGRLAA